MLDARALKSPAGKVIEVPNRFLALLVAGEWEAQKSVLKAHSLPLTSIFTRAEEMKVDEFKLKNQTLLLKYLATDTVLYHHDFPEQLVALQTAHWTPFLTHLHEKTTHLVEPTTGLSRITLPPAALEYFTRETSSMTALEFAAFEKAVLTSKSFLTGFALVKRWISVEDAVQISRVEVLSQIQRWGEVEDTHDVDREEMKRCLGASALVVM